MWPASGLRPGDGAGQRVPGGAAHLRHRGLPEGAEPRRRPLDVVPPQQRIDEQWYQGTADAVYQNIYTLEKERPEHVVILAGDHIYKMDYGKLIAQHVDKQADVTIAALRVKVTSKICSGSTPRAMRYATR